jgi:microcystin-dependent protein
MSAQRYQLGPFFHQGALCGAAKLYHYEAGSVDTLKSIWSDPDQLTTLAQPFISDASGVFNFFADGAYKFVITKSNGEVLYTLDNWRIQDVQQEPLTAGAAVATASNMDIGDATWAHWTGSTNVSALTGSALFYWAIADGSFTLVHSGSLILPDSRNRKVLAGDTVFFIRESSGIYRLSGHTQKEGGWTGRQGASYAATATLAVPPDGDFVQVSGGTSVTAVAAAAAGVRFRAMFTGTGLNITDNGTTMIGPWGRAYRTVPNEVIEFTSLGSGSWVYWSLNGPKERVGVSLEWNSTSLPAGYLWENGQAISRAGYPGLFAEIGTAFGVGDGSTTFNVPDCQGRMTLCVDGAANRVTSASTGGANADTMGGTGGAQTHTLSTSEIPVHEHAQGFDGVGTAAGGAASGSYGNETNTGSAGGGGAHNNMPPWIAKQKIIRF